MKQGKNYKINGKHFHSKKGSDLWNRYIKNSYEINMETDDLFSYLWNKMSRDIHVMRYLMSTWVKPNGFIIKSLGTNYDILNDVYRVKSTNCNQSFMKLLRS